ncbi:MAG: sigma-54 dependent transcriptional regulator [Fibrobacterota bacterium]
MKPNILIIDDDPATIFGFSHYLSNSGYEIETALSLKEAESKLLIKKLDAVLIDLNLPDGNGMDWIAKIRKMDPDTLIIMITGSGEITTAVEAMRKGADHYLAKPVDLEMLHGFISKRLELDILRRKDEAQRRTLKTTEPYFGNSPAIQKVFELASLAADNEAVILLQGETGTGKGVLARWLHERSKRAAAPFIGVNCASLRGELLSSELFGHVKGSFTSSVNDRQGLIEVASGGTLFLDEISDMDLGVQALLLKAIEEKTYRRLGETKERKSDFRLICATNRDLAEEVKKGKFRSDLYYRVCVFPIKLPSLCERSNDIPGLIASLLNAGSSNVIDISDSTIEMLKRYPWPGNIRELKNMLERAMILSRGKTITSAHFTGLEISNEPVPPTAEKGKIENMERSLIKDTLEQCSGDTKKASHILGISRASLYRKLVKIKESA